MLGIPVGVLQSSSVIRAFVPETNPKISTTMNNQKITGCPGRNSFATSPWCTGAQGAVADPVLWGRMMQQPASSNDPWRPSRRPHVEVTARWHRRAARVAILVMVLALAGVLPQVMFLVGSVGLIATAYMLDKRFKADVPATPSAAPAAPRAWLPRQPRSGPAASPAAPAATAPPPTSRPLSWPPAPAPATLAAPSPALLPVGDLQAEHARLTQELTDRVDDDEDVRFEKFMRLRKIDEELDAAAGPRPCRPP